MTIVIVNAGSDIGLETGPEEIPLSLGDSLPLSDGTSVVIKPLTYLLDVGETLLLIESYSSFGVPTQLSVIASDGLVMTDHLP